eukprot:scaffold43971_cov80-Cyclotella_meneghiniana.AAC.1
MTTRHTSSAVSQRWEESNHFEITAPTRHRLQKHHPNVFSQQHYYHSVSGGHPRGTAGVGPTKKNKWKLPKTQGFRAGMTRGGTSGTPQELARWSIRVTGLHGQAQYLQQPQSTVNTDLMDNDTIA